MRFAARLPTKSGTGCHWPRRCNTIRFSGNNLISRDKCTHSIESLKFTCVQHSTHPKAMNSFDITSFRHKVSEPSRCIQHRNGSNAKHTYIMPHAPKLIPQLTPKDKERFWAKVEKLGNESGCWLWVGYCDASGYGRFGMKRGLYMVHRVSFWIAFDIQDALVLHRCDTPGCVNPSHLFSGTQSENVHDMIAKGRRVKCFGEMNGSVKHPERVPRGDTHPARLRPERMARGENQGSAILNEEKVRCMRSIRATQKISLVKLATLFGVARETARNVLKMKTWAHVK